jgi:hypothetical protein
VRTRWFVNTLVPDRRSAGISPLDLIGTSLFRRRLTFSGGADQRDDDGNAARLQPLFYWREGGWTNPLVRQHACERHKHRLGKQPRLFHDSR